ncbi:MAG: DUF2029 domain-containing protein [Bdellovibrionales bacterium]|nr:DUF2029 domain-containing protein [Bdellovibrionales bacterium]
MNKRQSFIPVLVFVLIASTMGLLLVRSLHASYAFGSFGTNDFIEFWSAFQLFVVNDNPYDPEKLNAIQVSLGRAQESPLLLWNPPWVLTLMTPLLNLGFAASAQVFIWMNLVLLGAGAALLWSASTERRPYSPKSIGAAFLFLPALTNIQIGQIAIVLFFCIAGFVWAAANRRDFLAGLFLVPLSIKVHMVFLLLTAIAWWIVRFRRFRVFGGGAVGFSALIAATVAVSPNALNNWLGGFESPPFYWKTAALSGALRSLLFELTGDAPAWPVVVLPIIALFAVCLWLLKRRPTIDWTMHAPPLIALSIMFSPYGWLFDQTLLVCVQVVLLAKAFEPEVSNHARREVVLLLAVDQMFLVLSLISGFAMHHHFFWHPVAMLWVWYRSSRVLGLDSSER